MPLLLTDEQDAAIERYRRVVAEAWADGLAASRFDGAPETAAALARFDAALAEGGAVELAHRAVYQAFGGFVQAPPEVARALATIRCAVSLP